MNCFNKVLSSFSFSYKELLRLLYVLRLKTSFTVYLEITKLRLQSAQDAARQVEAEVAERISVLEKEHREKLSLLQSEKQYIEELQEERQHLKKEISELKHIGMQHEMHMKEEMEKVQHRAFSVILYKKFC